MVGHIRDDSINMYLYVWLVILAKNNPLDLWLRVLFIDPLAQPLERPRVGLVFKKLVCRTKYDQLQRIQFELLATVESFHNFTWSCHYNVNTLMVVSSPYCITNPDPCIWRKRLI